MSKLNNSNQEDIIFEATFTDVPCFNRGKKSDIGEIYLPWICRVNQLIEPVLPKGTEYTSSELIRASFDAMCDMYIEFAANPSSDKGVDAVFIPTCTTPVADASVINISKLAFIIKGLFIFIRKEKKAPDNIEEILMGYLNPKFNHHGEVIYVRK